MGDSLLIELIIFLNAMSNIGTIVSTTIGQTIHEQDSQAQFIAIMCVILLSLLKNILVSNYNR